MHIILTVIDGPQKGKRFHFHEPDNFLLGRDNAGSNAHFRLNKDDTQVSRNHFLLEINPPDCFIRDAGSLNGTFIVRPGNRQVYNGSAIRFHSFCCMISRFRLKSGYRGLTGTWRRL